MIAAEKKYTQEDVDLLNSKIGLYALLKSKRVNVDKALDEAKYVTALKRSQEELIKLQNWVIKKQKKVVILFEGRDAAGKGGAIRRITEYINPDISELWPSTFPPMTRSSSGFSNAMSTSFLSPERLSFLIGAGTTGQW